MGLLDRMDQLDSEAKISEQEQTTSATTTPQLDTKKSDKEVAKKKVPQLKQGAGKKIATGANKAATNNKFKSIAGSVKKPDALANARKTSKSSLHTHLNKTDQHGVSHKDRIEQELQAQVRKIKKIMVISIVSIVSIVVVILLIMKMFSSSPDSNFSISSELQPKITLGSFLV